MDKTFLLNTFKAYASQTDQEDPLRALLCDEWIDRSEAFDATGIQESWSWRNVHVARELALHLIDAKGELKYTVLDKSIKILEENLFSLGPDRHHDDRRHIYLLESLKKIGADKDYEIALKKIRAPEKHTVAEALIRETLFLAGIPITDSQARQAALSALLTMLRQNVGSCFATAPAILIQQDQPLQFLADVAEIFGTGKLKRIYEGLQHTVPLSISWGVGDLYKPFSAAHLNLNSLLNSPGLQAAFSAAALANPSTVLKDIVQQNPFVLLTPEILIKKILLAAHGITEEDVETTQYKEAEGVFGGLLIQTSSSTSDKKGRVAKYLKAYQAAKRAFRALTDNALLKAWEFTLASFAETKAEFAKWNLYASLGVNPEEPYGIGQALYQKIQEKIERVNKELEERQSHYDHLFAQAKYLEGRMRRVSSETEMSWVHAEYQVNRNEINQVLKEREMVYEKGERLSKIYSFIVDFYGYQVRAYFQEIYDPELHEVSSNFYDDTPAGFRLLYKHGRENPSLWTAIHTSNEYIQCLVAFFTATEHEFLHHPVAEGLERELSDLVTAIITTIKQPQFLESSIIRLARAYQEPLIRDPLHHLDQVTRKPWSYVSGGTMGTLVSCYYERSELPKETKRWVENDTELFAFLIDMIKELPRGTQKLYSDRSHASLLAFSPTHAFLCKPGWEKLRAAWDTDLYYYTWIRDQIIFPQLRFLDESLLDSRMVDYLFEEFLTIVPPGYQSLLRERIKEFPSSVHPEEFHSIFFDILSNQKWISKEALSLLIEELDSLLYRTLPLFHGHQITERLKLLFSHLFEPQSPLLEYLFKFIDEKQLGRYRIFSAIELRWHAQAFLMTALGKTRTTTPYYQKIVEAMQHLKLCYPAPVLVADTNWVKNAFGFIVNPGTTQLEFWRFDFSGSEGRPLSVWRPYLNGHNRKDWGFYNAPHQYGQF